MKYATITHKSQHSKVHRDFRGERITDIINALFNSTLEIGKIQGFKISPLKMTIVEPTVDEGKKKIRMFLQKKALPTKKT